MTAKNLRSDIQNISSKSIFLGSNSLFVLREDKLHPTIAGNKFRKLKYNLLEARKQGKSVLLTFGGAYSNHIAAVAVAGMENRMITVGVIRGEELADSIDENPTLAYAKSCGMRFHFVSREAYKIKSEISFIEELKSIFGDFYLLPEGGSNQLAVKGCEEMLTESTSSFDYICTAVGTGATIAGLVRAARPHQKVLGFSALKGTFQDSEIRNYTSKSNFLITDEYCFGGYAKIDSELVRFINEFKLNTEIQLDPIYTAKMMYGILDLINKGEFKENSRILAVHTGGLQGIDGMNQLLKKKNLPQINI